MVSQSDLMFNAWSTEIIESDASEIFLSQNFAVAILIVLELLLTSQSFDYK